MANDCSFSHLSLFNQLSEGDLRQLTISSNRLNLLLRQSIQKFDMSTLRGGIRFKMIKSMTDDKFELDYHKMMAMLTYILAEPMRVSHDYAAFESLFVLVFEGVQEKISNENLLTLLDSLKTMIYVIQMSVKYMYNNDEEYSHQKQVNLLVKFFQQILKGYTSANKQRYLKELGENFDFAFRNKKVIWIIKMLYQMEFILWELYDDPLVGEQIDNNNKLEGNVIALQKRLQCVCNNPKLSLCIQLLAVLGLRLLKRQKDIDQQYWQYFLKLVESTIEKMILLRSNLQKVDYLLYHMKHNDFFNIVSMLFRDDVAYLGVTDSWKSKVRLSIENYGNRKDTKITLDQCLFYLQLLPDHADGFAGLSCRIVRSQLTHEFIKQILHSNQTDMTVCLMRKLQRFGIDELRKLFLEFSNIEAAVVIYYFFSCFTSNQTGFEPGESNEIFPKLLVQFHQLLSFFPLTQLNNMIQFMLFELRFKQSDASPMVFAYQRILDALFNQMSLQLIQAQQFNDQRGDNILQLSRLIANIKIIIEGLDPNPESKGLTLCKTCRRSFTSILICPNCSSITFRFKLQQATTSFFSADSHRLALMKHNVNRQLTQIHHKLKQYYEINDDKIDENNMSRVQYYQLLRFVLKKHIVLL